jgi:UDP-N-acetylmuramoyl-L-alanyl-D-glutamate--2,6-diaminopimelate ligase
MSVLPGAPVELARLCAGHADAPAGLTVTDLSLDSRTVERDGLFLACAGRRTHGLATLEIALARGVRAVLWEPAPGIAPPAARAGVWMAPMHGLAQQASAIADRFFDAPSASLSITGVTGTNGKTTVAWLLAQALDALRSLRDHGGGCIYIGTLGVGTPPDQVIAGEYTTADAVTVQRQLADARAAGAGAVAMEVSSHALDQHRVAAVRFRSAVFTNLTRDHLDYHGTFEAYGAAKARLFDMPGLGDRVFNVDDDFGATLAADQAGRGRAWLTCRTAAGRAAAARCLALDPGAKMLAATAVRRSASGLAFEIEMPAGTDRALPRVIEAPLVGDFNIDNLLSVFAALLALEVSPTAALEALARVTAPPGRMQAIGAEGQPLVVVDYAHTPDALAKALAAARLHCKGRLILVFGCGGDRDRGKRPQMAAIAADLADGIVVTDDNPRTESPEQIAAQIVAGLPAGRHAEIIHDRAAAIRAALASAGAEDVVLVAGKGHEDYQIIGAERRPFDDAQQVRVALGLASPAMERG